MFSASDGQTWLCQAINRDVFVIFFSFFPTLPLLTDRITCFTSMHLISNLNARRSILLFHSRHIHICSQPVIDSFAASTCAENTDRRTSERKVETVRTCGQPSVDHCFARSIVVVDVDVFLRWCSFLRPSLHMSLNGQTHVSAFHIRVHSSAFRLTSTSGRVLFLGIHPAR